MVAPKGNQFWKQRSTHGRKKLFETSKLMWDAACEYFQWCDDHPWIEEKTFGKKKTNRHKPVINIETKPTQRPYTISGLCLYLDCNVQYFTDFKSALDKDEHDFSIVITRIEQIIYTNKYEGAVVGAFNANIIARDLGLKDEQKHDHSSKDGTMSPKELTPEIAKAISNNLDEKI